MNVRERTPGDLPACVAVLREVHEADGYPTVWPDDPVGWLHPGEPAWVAEDPAGVLGHVAVVRIAAVLGDAPAVSRLFVSPRARGRGLGTGAALLARAQGWAVRRGLPLVLDVVEDGGPAAELYERLGWELVGRRDADWVTPAGVRHRERIYRAPGGPEFPQEPAVVDCG